MSAEIASGLVRWRVPLSWALGLLALILARPIPVSYAIGLGIAAVGEALRIWSAGHLVKGTGVTRSGPYAWTRNPLYLGSAIMGVGFCVAARSWVLLVLFAGLLLGVILPVIRTEARKLAELHPQVYSEYAKAVPLCLPGIGPRREWLHERDFDWTRVKVNREHRAVLGWFGAALILGVKMLAMS